MFDISLCYAGRRESEILLDITAGARSPISPMLVLDCSFLPSWHICTNAIMKFKSIYEWVVSCFQYFPFLQTETI